MLFQRLILGLVTALIVFGGSLAYKYYTRSEINDFASCAAKYPVQESYPEQCTVPGGRSFTNPNQAMPGL